MSAKPIDKFTNDVASIDAAIQSRYSCRAFVRDKPVPRHLLEEILQVARRAPSGTNTQPWQVYVLQGQQLASLVDKVCAAYECVYDNPALAPTYHEEYEYYPRVWMSPYLERRRANGWGLYGLLGIVKGDKERMRRQHCRNFQFFDAPTGLMFTLHRGMSAGSLIDYGMFLQSIMIAAKARGLDTCPQAAWMEFSKIVLKHLDASDSERLVCGMALGYADKGSKVNSFHTPREEVIDFTRWLGAAA